MNIFVNKRISRRSCRSKKKNGKIKIAREKNCLSLYKKKFRQWVIRKIIEIIRKSKKIYFEIPESI